jgi:outer membrane protein OmpA-like peptidoglycan-associated protein
LIQTGAIFLFLVFAVSLGGQACAADVVKSDLLIKKLDQQPIFFRGAKRTNSKPPAVDLSIRFAFDSADLLSEAREQLDELGAALSSRRLNKYRFQIVGHTDAVGLDKYNLELSSERAETVKNYLVATYGITASRLAALGQGESQLKNTVDPMSGENRRVEVINLGK